MKPIIKSYQSQKYKSNTHRVASRTPLIQKSNNYRIAANKECICDLKYTNLTLKNKSLLDSLNIERRNYIYVDNMPDSNNIYYDSNMKKYRTESESLTKPSYTQKTFNASKKQSLVTTRNQSSNINNRYNQTIDYTKQTATRKYNLAKPQEQVRNRDTQSANIKPHLTQNYASNSKYQTTNTRRGASSTAAVAKPTLTSTNNQNSRKNHYTTRSEQGKDLGQKNYISGNKTTKVNTNYRINSQTNQGIKRGEKEEQKRMLLDKIQKDKGREGNKYVINKPNPQQSKITQENIVNRRNNTNSNSVAKTTNINRAPASQNQTANIPRNYTPINKSVEKNIPKDIPRIPRMINQEQKDSLETQLRKIEKLQSPYKNEEIVKDENGEIIKKKEEKTIILLPGQTIEPKTVIETFEKPVIDVIENEDGTAQSIYKQTKIITNVENIPIKDPKTSNKKTEEDLQLIKQIITHEYKTVSATKKDMEKEKWNETLENKREKEANQKKEKDEKGEIIPFQEEENDEKEEKDVNKMRYMDIVEDENAQKGNIMKDNKNIENKDIVGKQKEIKDKPEMLEDMKKIKENIFNPKNKGKNKLTNEKINQKEGKKEEATSKSKNIKSGLTEKQQAVKKETKAEQEKKSGVIEKKPATKKETEKAKEKEKDKFNLTTKNKPKENTTDEQIKKKLNLTNTQDKKEQKQKDIKEKSKQDSSKNEINSNIKKTTGKNKEEVNLRKSFKRNKKEEKEAKKPDISENMKNVSDLYEKCFKLGNKPGSEKDLGKMVEILMTLEEKERKDILGKLLKTYAKSSDLNQKILNLINTKNLDSNDKIKTKGKEKGKEKGNKLSLEKETQKESRSKSQTKAKDKKQHLQNDEFFDNIDITKNIKFGGTLEKKSFGSNQKRDNRFSLNHEAYSVNVANIGDLKFDGLFLDISKYQNKERYHNPFEGPSSFYKFYKIRQSKIKKKIIDMTTEAKNNTAEK